MNHELLTISYANRLFHLSYQPICDLIMQNKPNLPKAQMNVTKVLTKGYGNNSNWTLGENKPNTNPIKANTKPIIDNIMPKQTQFKPNQTQFHTNLGVLKLVSTSLMIKSFLNFFGSPRVIVGKTGLTIRKDPLGISRAKTGNRVRFRN